MAEIKSIGDQVPADTGSGEAPALERAGGLNPKPIGTRAPVNWTPVPSPSADPPSGEFKMIGDAAPVDRTPVKGWGSAANLPMSDRAVEQSQVKTRKGGKGK